MDADEPGRWGRLFADLEAQYDAADAADLEAEVRERARGETARLRLVDRLRVATGHDVVVEVIGTGSVRGSLNGVGPDWLLLDDGRDLLIPLAAVLGIAGLTPWSGSPGTETAVEAKLGVGYALREIGRRRVPVRLSLTDGRTLHGTLDRVGADFVELAEHLAGEPRRAKAVTGVRTVPFAAIAAVRSTG